MKGKRLFVYVAGPYTKGDVGTNVNKHLTYVNLFAELGMVPFAPLLCHFWHLVYPHNYEFWTEYGLAWIPKCDIMFRTPGESKGADEEVLRAMKLNIPVFYSLSEIKDYLNTQKSGV